MDEKIIDKQFFLELTSTNWFDDLCNKGSDGTTQRIRLQKTKFFNQEINLPTLTMKKEIVSRLKSIKQFKKLIEKTSYYADDLAKSVLDKAFEEKTNKEVC